MAEAPEPQSIHIGDKPQNRGQLIHGLLQWLPNYPPEVRADKSRAFLANHTVALSNTMRNNLSEVALRVVSTPELAHVFGPESRAEVPLVGSFSRHGRTYNVFTHIHRLTVKENTVNMVLFATEQHVPKETTAFTKEAYKISDEAFVVKITHSVKYYH